jgi:hypothetical protein
VAVVLFSDFVNLRKAETDREQPVLLHTVPERRLLLHVK